MDTVGDNAMGFCSVVELKNGAGLLKDTEIVIGQHVPNTLTALKP